MSHDYGKEKKTLRDAVLTRLWDLEWHSFAEMAQVGGIRYGARILELKRLGYSIDSMEFPAGNHYRLLSRTQKSPKIKKVKVYLTEEEADWLSKGFLPPTARQSIQAALASFRANKHKL